jgi:NTP pyrophosphatase (non-canonical NTP hydrolase)
MKERDRLDTKDYTKEVQRTSGLQDQKEILTLTALGIAGESGEVVDIIKKVLYHQHDLDTARISEELGDLLWYITRLADALGLSLDDIMQTNVAKLHKRYPDGFNPERSKNRNDYEKIG